jgi:uncharacterized protein
MARSRASLAAILATLLAALAAPALPASAACAPDVADLRHEDVQVRFSVEVADTEAARARGLMFREELPRFAGMLFVYDAPQLATFWMENTPLPLDMLFFDEAGVMVNLHENAVPFSRDIIVGGEDVLFVLEINAGLARELGIGIGAELRHPAVDPDEAAWSCD